MNLQWKIIGIWLWASNRTTNIPFQFEEDFSSDGKPVANAYFLSNPEVTRGLELSLDFSVVSPHATGSEKDFTLVTGRKYRKETVSPLAFSCLRGGSFLRLCACLVFVWCFWSRCFFISFFLVELFIAFSLEVLFLEPLKMLGS